ncbi:MAG TPA: DUF6807 family protein, partial [Isosphaeraceae bacterium]|nr:DUF6807 family protein [Isosphaeraceae bacterium]
MPLDLQSMVAALIVSITPLVGLPAGATAADVGRDGSLTLRVEAGERARRDTPVRFDLPASDLPAAVWQALADGPRSLALHEVREGDSAGEAVIAQAERLPAEGPRRVRLTWILAGAMPASSSRLYRLDPAPITQRHGPWTITELPAGQLDLKNGERTVFRYNFGPSSHPNYGRILTRDAYIHPAFTPSGALITGDFSKFHPHHRGFFLAYTKTQVGNLHPDFWNIQSGSSRIVCDWVETPSAGPV